MYGRGFSEPNVVFFRPLADRCTHNRRVYLSPSDPLTPCSGGSGSMWQTYQAVDYLWCHSSPPHSCPSQVISSADCLVCGAFCHGHRGLELTGYAKGTGFYDSGFLLPLSPLPLSSLLFIDYRSHVNVARTEVIQDELGCRFERY